MKVLHVIPSISHVHGGPSAAIRTMVSATTAAGAAADVATTDDDGAFARLRVPLGERVAGVDGMDVHFFPRQSLFYKVSMPLARWLWLNVRNYDVIHVHALFSFSSTAAAHVARWRDVPYIVRPLGVLRRYGMTQHRPAVKKLSFAVNERGIVAASSAVHFTSREELAEAVALGDVPRPTLIPLGVPLRATGSPERFLHRWPHLRDSDRLLFLGRLDPVKNLDGLIEALPPLLARFPSVRLVVAGEGDASYARQLRDLAERTGVADSIVWAGQLSGPDKEDALAAAHLFVLPSHSENFGIAAAEALGSGLPCVLASGVGIARDVGAAGAGLIVEAAPAALAAGIASILADPDLRDRMGRSARLLALREYSTQAMARSLLELYEQVVAAHQREGGHGKSSGQKIDCH